MNEESTRELPDKRSFEERVFARFDVIDTRLQALEARALDTKPIWERALAEILEVKKGVEDLNRKDRRFEPGCSTGSRRSETRS
jgi:hypothetical protein